MSQEEHLPDEIRLAPQEQGYPSPDAPMIASMPAGLGKQAIPQFVTFGQLANYASRTYRWAHDEALKHSYENAKAMRRDPIVMSALRARQMSVAQLSWHIECLNPEDMRQAAAAKLIEDIIKRTPKFQQLKMGLLEGVFYGRYAAQLAYGWDFSDGQRRMVVKSHKPINGDKLIPRWSGQWGILVHALYDGTWDITERGRAHFFTDYEREQVIVHEHEPEDADFFDSQLAGGIHGVGIRSRIYWFWYLKSQTMSFLMDYLERLGAGGITIYYYEHGNDASLAEVKACAEAQFKNHTILMPRYRDNSTGGPGIDRIEPSNNGAQLLENLVTQYYDAQIRRYILGQDLTSEAGPGGTDGVATLHGETYNRIIKYDAENLASTLTEDFVRVLQKYNVPHDIPPLRFVFDVDKVNAGEMLEAANQFYQMGGSIGEDSLRTVIGLPRPKPGEAVLTQNMPMNPATLGTVPEGTPMEGAPAPMPEGEEAPVQMARVKYQQKEKKEETEAEDKLRKQKEKITEWRINRMLRDLATYKPKNGESFDANSRFGKALEKWKKEIKEKQIGMGHYKSDEIDVIKTPEDAKKFMKNHLERAYAGTSFLRNEGDLEDSGSVVFFGDFKGAWKKPNKILKETQERQDRSKKEDPNYESFQEEALGGKKQFEEFEKQYSEEQKGFLGQDEESTNLKPHQNPAELAQKGADAQKAEKAKIEQEKQQPKPTEQAKPAETPMGKPEAQKPMEQPAAKSEANKPAPVEPKPAIEPKPAVAPKPIEKPIEPQKPIAPKVEPKPIVKPVEAPKPPEVPKAAEKPAPAPIPKQEQKPIAKPAVVAKPPVAVAPKPPVAAPKPAVAAPKPAVAAKPVEKPPVAAKPGVAPIQAWHKENQSKDELLKRRQEALRRQYGTDPRYRPVPASMKPKVGEYQGPGAYVPLKPKPEVQQAGTQQPKPAAQSPRQQASGISVLQQPKRDRMPDVRPSNSPFVPNQ